MKSKHSMAENGLKHSCRTSNDSHLNLEPSFKNVIKCMAEVHRVTWELPIMLPQIITTTLSPYGQYPPIRYQNW